MKKKFAILCAGFSLMLTTGCANLQTKEGQGTLIGSGVGAALGAGLGQAIGGNTKSTLIGAGIGAAVGGIAGNQWGKHLDQQEAALRQQFAQSEAVAIRREKEQLSLTFKSDAMFSLGSATPSAGFYNDLARVAQVLNKYPDSVIIVRGHTDSTGSEQTNQALSERRANAVKNALVGHGVNPERILTIGYGESEPVADNSTETGRQLNRRVEITIAPPQKDAVAGKS